MTADMHMISRNEKDEVRALCRDENARYVSDLHPIAPNGRVTCIECLRMINIIVARAPGALIDVAFAQIQK